MLLMTVVMRMFKKFCSGCKNFSDQAKWRRVKSINFKAVLQTIEANLVSSTWRVSGKLSISPSNWVHHPHNLGKCTKSCWIVPHITKIVQNFWLTQVNNRTSPVSICKKKFHDYFSAGKQKLFSENTVVLFLWVFFFVFVFSCSVLNISISCRYKNIFKSYSKVVRQFLHFEKFS